MSYYLKVNKTQTTNTEKKANPQIKENIINKQSYLYEEPNFLLQNEVSEVGSYFSIIKSIFFDISPVNKNLTPEISVYKVIELSLSSYPS